MHEFYFSAELDDNHTLCLVLITDRRISLSGQEIIDPREYSLFEKSGSGDLADIQIITRIFSEEAVLRLREAFGMS